MKFPRCVLAVLAATILFAWLGSAETEAFPPRQAYYGSAYSNPGTYGYAWGYDRYWLPYNPYVAPLPYYGILPPPAVMWDQLYRDPSASLNPAGRTDYLDYTPRYRDSGSPAVPYQRNAPGDRDLDLRRARFEITVPTGRTVIFFDGAPTTQTGLERVFVTPALVADKVYSSTIEAQWMDEAGTKITRRKAFEFGAGATVRYRFAE